MLSHDIVIVEPSDRHYYQPGFTLYGTGLFTPEQLRRPTASLIPKVATWLRASAKAEFGYGGAPQSSFPTWLIDGTKLSRLAWIFKKDLLPPIYWDAMLKGHEWLAAPKLLQDAGR